MIVVWDIIPFQVHCFIQFSGLSSLHFALSQRQQNLVFQSKALDPDKVIPSLGPAHTNSDKLFSLLCPRFLI